MALGGDFDLAREPEFAPLRKFEPYRELEHRQSLRAPARTSTLAFRLSDPELVPEGIAFDPVDGVFYVGSLHRRSILRVDRAGRETVLVAPGRDSLWAVLGLRVDPKRRLLWAASAADGREGAAAGSSALFAFELPGGALHGRWVLSEPPRKHLLNDLVVTDDGDVYATDSQSGEIRRLPSGAGALESFLPPATVDYPNGIALAATGRRLYVADFAKGLSIVELATRAVRPLPHPRGLSVHEIDGLYRVGGRLVAIQNGPGMERVVAFGLDEAGERVVDATVLESRNPDFDAPTTGAVTDGAFYYLANAQVEKLGDDGKIKPGSAPSPVRIFRMPLP